MGLHPLVGSLLGAIAVATRGTSASLPCTPLGAPPQRLPPTYEVIKWRMIQECREECPVDSQGEWAASKACQGEALSANDRWGAQHPRPPWAVAWAGEVQALDRASQHKWAVWPQGAKRTTSS